MTRNLTIAFFCIVAVQVFLLLGIIGFKEFTLGTGTTVVLQTVPVDPRSLFQGDYVILRYEISNLAAGELSHLRQGDTVYAVLVEGGEVWRDQYYSQEIPSPSDVFIRGELESPGRLDFGIGTYFVPEGTGWVIERARDIKVKAKVDQLGNAVIQQILLDGEPFDPDKTFEDPTR